MTIGYPNILTAIWFILMLGIGIILAFMTFDKLFNSEIIFIAKFFVIVSYILATGTLIFFLLKFRLIFVTKNKLISIHLFKFSKKILLKDNVKSIEWATWEIKAHMFISLTIIDKNGNEISISDFEIENFHSIAAAIIGENYLVDSGNHFKEQAKENISLNNFIGIITVVFFIFFIVKIAVSKNLDFTHLIFSSLLLLIIIATLKRRNKYHKVAKYVL